jgi:hypothetical protein
LTTTAVAGPERSGSGAGWPVPSRTTCVFVMFVPFGVDFSDANPIGGGVGDAALIGF